MIKKVWGGRTRAFMMDEQHKVYGTGNDVISGLKPCLNFTAIPLLLSDKPVVHMAVGANFSYALLSDGSLWAAGNNINGNLGLGTSQEYYTAYTRITTLPQDKKIISLSAGGFYLLVLLEDGSLWGTGSNGKGQLGLGHTEGVRQFTRIDTLPVDKRVIAVETCHDGDVSFVILEDNNVWATGDNGRNQLGFNNTTACNRFSQLTTLPENKRVIRIAPGTFHTQFLLDDGSLWGTGDNYCGILGLTEEALTSKLEGTEFFKLSRITALPPNNPILKVLSSRNNTFILLKDGTLWGAGSNFHHQLGLDHNEQRLTFQHLNTLPSDKAVVGFTIGYGSTYALLEDGSLWVAGNNGFGQLGLGDKDERAGFIACPITDTNFSSANAPLASLQEKALQVSREKLSISPYEADAFSTLAEQMTVDIASKIFMPHLYGCSDCKRYVKPTVWGECSYPHTLFRSPATSTITAASSSVKSELTKSDEAGPAASHNHKC